MKRLVLLGALGCAAAFAAVQPGGIAVLDSPDGRIVVTFQTLSDQQPAGTGGKLTYAVSFKGRMLITPSALELDLEGQPPLGPNLRIASSNLAEADGEYRLLAGKTSSVKDHYKALRLELAEPGVGGRKLTIEARVYNDAVAFRYLVPAQPGLSEYRLAAERTEFRFSRDATAYALELPNTRSMYESEFIKLPVSAFCNQGGVKSPILIGLPTLLEFPGIGWAAITEADLKDNAAMYLVNPSQSWTGHWFESRIAPQQDHPDICVTAPLPHHSAWRVILMGEEPGRLIESNAVTSLNPDSAIPDTSWIHPGKAAWNWWSGSLGPDGKPAYTTENMKYYVDFAARSHFEYMLIDGGWSDRVDILHLNGKVDVPEVVRYATSKGVGVWIWLRYDGVVKHMDAAFPLYEKWGVAGVKIDFIERDDQEGIEFYYRVADYAAQHHLMVDFHGATKPTGMERTWPNVLGYEAVLGMEQSKAGTRDNPPHRVTLPFTRMLAGPMDYTPGGFRNVTREDFEPRFEHTLVMGTRAQQLAMYVVYEAPLQMVADAPSAYEGEKAFQFIKDVPSTWDETRVLQGLPGEYVAIARRKGDQWFVGAMTDWTPRRLAIPLNFLGDGRFTAEVYADSADADRFPRHVTTETLIVTRGATLDARLASGGGYAIRLSPEAAR